MIWRVLPAIPTCADVEGATGGFGDLRFCSNKETGRADRSWWVSEKRASRCLGGEVLSFNEFHIMEESGKSFAEDECKVFRTDSNRFGVRKTPFRAERCVLSGDSDAASVGFVPCVEVFVHNTLAPLVVVGSRIAGKCFGSINVFFYQTLGLVQLFLARISFGIERLFEDYRIVASRFGGLFADAAVRTNTDPVMDCELRHNLREPIPPFAVDCRRRFLGLAVGNGSVPKGWR